MAKVFSALLLWRYFRYTILKAVDELQKILAEGWSSTVGPGVCGIGIVFRRTSWPILNHLLIILHPKIPTILDVDSQPQEVLFKKKHTHSFGTDGLYMKVNLT